MSNLQPTPIIDRNGKQTTVHKRVVSAQPSVRLSSISLTEKPITVGNVQIRSFIDDIVIARTKNFELAISQISDPVDDGSAYHSVDYLLNEAKGKRGVGGYIGSESYYYTLNEDGEHKLFDVSPAEFSLRLTPEQRAEVEEALIAAAPFIKLGENDD